LDAEIRHLRTTEEFEACERLQRRVWAMPDDRGVVPLHLLLSAQRNGGLVLGAFVSGTLAGFLFGYPGLTTNGRLKHCSHMMGVAPELQSRGVGYRLKLVQREFALGQGCDLVTWTYDPLESRNAFLNIHKLGGVCRTYIRDFYGPMDDKLNRGLPSDRFEVEWWIASQHVKRRLAGGDGGEMDEAELTRLVSEREVRPGNILVGEGPTRVWVEIPADYQAIRTSDPAPAAEWRTATREALEAQIERGYVVSDLACPTVLGARRCFYLLSKGGERGDDAHRAD
jgi:predicted GNAT superfamily acetyltransferase